MKLTNYAKDKLVSIIGYGTLAIIAVAIIALVGWVEVGM